MKNKRFICLSFALLGITSAATAQNTFPNSGNVGIGTLSPSYPLTVNGNVKLQDRGMGYLINYAALSETNGGASTILGNNIMAGATNNKIKVFVNPYDAASFVSLNYINGITFHTGILGGLNTEISADDNERMRIAQNGNVGIGTITPGQKLDVNGSINVGKYTYFKNSGTADYPNSFLHRLRAEDGYLFIDGDAGSSTYVPAISIHRQGNVGIGTTTPREKLSVNGKIRAHEIKVEAANWPDYVFEEGYKVGKLEELESYIKANKRLPEMPSAKEAEANGVELGEMNKLLLKKQEELTLYLIEQNKQLQALLQQVQLQQKEIEELKAKKGR